MRHRLKAARVAAGLTQKSLATRAGLDFRRVNGFEMGKRRPRAEELAALCQALQLRVEDFLPEPRLTAQLVERFQLRSPETDEPRPLPHWERVSLQYGYELRMLGFMQDLPLWFRCECTYDSELEVYAVLQLYSEGATPMRCNPALLDLRTQVVVDREGRGLGRRELPCLHWKRPQLEALLCPQTTVLVGRELCRIDLMAFVHTPYHPPFVAAVEIDGAGHRGTRDRYRAAKLQMPILRFTEEQVMSGRFGDELALAILDLSIRLSPAGRREAK